MHSFSAANQTALHSKGFSFTYFLNCCLPSSIHKLSIGSSPTLSYFKTLLPFLWHKIPCRALKGLKARQSSLWNCLKHKHIYFISANSGLFFYYFFLKHDKQLQCEDAFYSSDRGISQTLLVLSVSLPIYVHQSLRLCLTMDSQKPSGKDWQNCQKFSRFLMGYLNPAQVTIAKAEANIPTHLGKIVHYYPPIISTLEVLHLQHPLK